MNALYAVRHEHVSLSYCLVCNSGSQSVVLVLLVAMMYFMDLKPFYNTVKDKLHIQTLPRKSHYSPAISQIG